jgi:DNA-damage-inducible protein J
MTKPQKPIVRAKRASSPQVRSGVAKPKKDAKTAMITVRIAPEHKAKAEKIFGKLGISMSDGIGMYLKQVIHYKGIPLELRIPNKETRAAMQQMQQRKGIAYTTLQEMWDDIL